MLHTQSAVLMMAYRVWLHAVACRSVQALSVWRARCQAYMSLHRVGPRWALAWTRLKVSTF